MERDDCQPVGVGRHAARPVAHHRKIDGVEGGEIRDDDIGTEETHPDGVIPGNRLAARHEIDDGMDREIEVRLWRQVAERDSQCVALLTHDRRRCLWLVRGASTEAGRETRRRARRGTGSGTTGTIVQRTAPAAEHDYGREGHSPAAASSQGPDSTCVNRTVGPGPMDKDRTPAY